MSKEITVNSRKMDGLIHRSWKAELIYKSSRLIVLEGKFSETVKHSELGIIERGTISIEYFWRDCWFNVFRFHHPNGEFRNFYCNINTPPTLCNNVLDYTDLEIDVLVNKDHSYRILDLDEFSARTQTYHLSSKFQTKINHTLAELLQLIEKRQFPFANKKSILK